MLQVSLEYDADKKADKMTSLLFKTQPSFL